MGFAGIVPWRGRTGLIGIRVVVVPPSRLVLNKFLLASLKALFYLIAAFIASRTSCAVGSFLNGSWVGGCGRGDTCGDTAGSQGGRGGGGGGSLGLGPGVASGGPLFPGPLLDDGVFADGFAEGGPPGELLARPVDAWRGGWSSRNVKFVEQCGAPPPSAVLQCQQEQWKSRHEPRNDRLNQAHLFRRVCNVASLSVRGVSCPAWVPTAEVNVIGCFQEIDGLGNAIQRWNSNDIIARVSMT